MQHSLKKELLDYFNKIEDRTSQENRLRLFLANDVEFFDISSVSREDVDETGFDGQNMTEDQMEHLSNKMDRAYVEDGFWQDIASIADDMGIDKISKEDKMKKKKKKANKIRKSIKKCGLSKGSIVINDSGSITISGIFYNIPKARRLNNDVNEHLGH